jgi:serine/threonine protein kinase
LVSRPCSDGAQKAYALKVQSKYDLCNNGQAKAVIQEKNIMERLHHPFLTNLVNAYQDTDLVYMLMGLVQGGELHGVMHTPRKNKISEKAAQFYAAGIAEGLAFMHRRSYVYRDLKPENVMIDSTGYPVIVDFGFVKFVTDKTYTLCGTPLYIAPEVILNRGHDGGADHWSQGVLIFEMLTGETPFYEAGMDQMELFQKIVYGKFDMRKWTKSKPTYLIHPSHSRTHTQTNLLSSLKRWQL